jgi:tetratricopeptide (TPR) repeat protein
MAHYFTGNVYNDWGSQVNADSLNARGKGDQAEAQRLRQKALDMWAKSEESYAATKALMPNYVQTHHQMGLLYLKRAEQAAAWGESDKSRELYAQALHNFRLYQMLDPVFPQNYDRIVQILLLDNRVKESIALYREAVRYNETVSRSIRNNNFPDRLPAICNSLAKLLFTDARNTAADPFNPPLPQIKEAIEMFRLSLSCDPNNLEALKGLGLLLDKTGQKAEAQVIWQNAHRIAPNDPDIRATPN